MVEEWDVGEEKRRGKREEEWAHGGVGFRAGQSSPIWCQHDRKASAFRYGLDRRL